MYLDDTKVLNLQSIIIDDEYDNDKTRAKIISLIKREMTAATSKTKLVINNTKH